MSIRAFGLAVIDAATALLALSAMQLLPVLKRSQSAIFF